MTSLQKYHECGIPLPEPITDFRRFLAQLVSLNDEPSVIGVVVGMQLTSPRMLEIQTEEGSIVVVPAFHENFLFLREPE